MAFDPENSGDVAAALAQTFAPQLFHQMNREAATLAHLKGEVGGGKNCAWDVEFTGTTGLTESSRAEGADVADADYGTDIPVPATLDWAEYGEPFALTETEIIEAATSSGTPEALVDIIGDRVLLRGAKLAAAVNADVFSGDGTDSSGNKNIVGFYGGACDDSGLYATINRATYDEWKSTVLANGSVARALTLDLLAQAEEQLFKKCGRAPICLCTSAGVRRKYQGLFQEVQRVVTPGTPPPQWDPVPNENEYFYQGAPVRRDRQAPAGKLLMMAMEPKIRFLPPMGQDKNTVETRIRQMMGTTGGPDGRMTASAMPFQITPLAKTGTSVKFLLTVRPQLVVPRPNAFVVIEDISES